MQVSLSKADWHGCFSGLTSDTVLLGTRPRAAGSYAGIVSVGLVLMLKSFAEQAQVTQGSLLPEWL